MDGQSVNMDYETNLEEYKDLIRQNIKIGRFVLHSGQQSTWIFDGLPLTSDFLNFMDYLYPQYKTMGIEFLGAILALSYDGNMAGIIRKDGNILEPPVYGARMNSYNNPRKIVTLVDDVVTTEASFNVATHFLKEKGIEVGEYIVLLDRRKEIDKHLEIKSLATSKDFDLPSL